LRETLKQLGKLSGEKLVAERYAKFRKMGVYSE